MTDLKFILFFIIALVFYIIYVFSKSTQKHFNEVKEQEIQAIGKIVRIVEDDSGYPWFYIELEDKGVKLTAKTSSYKGVPDNLEKGYEVNVKYHFSKNGKAYCRIIDDDFNSIINYNDDTASKKVDNYILDLSDKLFIMV